MHPGEDGEGYPSSYTYHRVFNLAYYVHCSCDESLYIYIYKFRRDNDCVVWFAEELKNLAYKIKIILSTNVPMADFRRDDMINFNNATNCHVCEKQFAPDDTRLRDHCHLIARYRDSAHSIELQRFILHSHSFP